MTSRARAGGKELHGDGVAVVGPERVLNPR
jgi:hypothetical protein